MKVTTFPGMVNSRAARLILMLLIFGMSARSVDRAVGRQREGQKDSEQTNTDPGKRIFTSTCSGCHGLDGRGGERAPTVAGSARVGHFSDTELAELISNGIPGTGMPPFHSLTKTEVRAVVGYIRSLQGAVDSRTPPGDARRGEAVFFGKAECSHCHAISGKGGFIGPDLSSYGSKISANAIREGIIDPNRIVPQGYKLATAVIADGRRIQGIVRNEDNFSVQLLTLDGDFHFFDRNDLQKLEYAGRSLMPANYGERLSRNELDDLVSYLMSPGSSDTKPHTPETNEDDAE